MKKNELNCVQLKRLMIFFNIKHFYCTIPYFLATFLKNVDLCLFTTEILILFFYIFSFLKYKLNGLIEIYLPQTL